jgi:NTE family protein
MKKVGVVLSGDGARSFAHLGLLKVLEEEGIKPCAISGVSGGALVGALYAAGISSLDILELGKANSLFGFSGLSLKKEGFFSMESIRKLIIENIPHNSFEKLKIRLFVNATDFNHNKVIFFSEGKLMDCLIASASVPVLFNPVEYENSLLVDGGLLNNFPVEPLLDICDYIIGSHVNKLEDLKEGNNKLTKIAILERSFHMAIASNVYLRARHCNLLLEPGMDDFGLFDMKNVDTIFEIGYKHALKQKNKIAELAG